VNRLTVINRT